jgi:hypothetical protein
MKSVITTSMLAVLALSTPAAIAAENTPAKPMAGKSMGMMDDKQMAQMQDNMKRMQEQMDKVHQTKDPKERQKLMQEHMQTMHSNMQMMRGMGGPMMGGRGGGPMAGMDPKQRQDMMEKRMDMMQMMMEQMMQHDRMNQGMPPK